MMSNVKIIFLPAMMIAFSFCGEQVNVNDSELADSVGVNTIDISANADTVNNPALVTASDDGSLKLTAENGKAAGPDIKYMPEWKAFGWFTAADSVTWDVAVKAEGEYDVHLAWAVSDEEAGKEFILTANGRQLTGTVAKSGSWETFKTRHVGQIKLEGGRQKIVFRSKTKFDKGALLDLRQITLLRASG